MPKHLLRNSDLLVEIIPEEGGRVASLKSRHTGVEFLTQSQRTCALPGGGLHARFQDGPSAGIEECLPTVGPCSDETTGGAVPDHGDFWQMNWNLIKHTDTSLCLDAAGFSRPLRFQKEFSLTGKVLTIEYSLTNLGEVEISTLYACHPLLAVDAEDRICLPQEISHLSLYYSRHERIGAKGETILWPEPRPGVALDSAQPPHTGFAEMLYTDRLGRGICGLYRSTAHQGLSLRFDAGELPYLGLWLCYGGWPSDGEHPQQYAVALEPTFAPVNTLKEAQDAGSARSLQPGETIQWTIAFHVSEPDLALHQFLSLFK